MTDCGAASDVLGRVTDELLERHRQGERPALSDYIGRYPELAEEIRELFSALVLMEGVRPERPAAAQGAVRVPAGEVPFEHLGDYRIFREIGRGGMGVVYEAEQESLGRRVALKVLPAEAFGNPTHIQRFQREARAAARLHHTNIVPVFGVGEDHGTHYYAMQYIEGRPLDEVLTELRRLRDGGTTPQDGSSASVLAAGDARSEAHSLVESRPRSSAEVARSLWEGRFRAASQHASVGSIDPQAATRHGNAAGSPAARTPSRATATTSSASTSSLLSDPHRPYAKSIAHIGAQVAEALEYAANQGVLHRDIKPSNLLLDVWGTVWLTDFGLAKATGTPDLTRTGHIFGTLRYLAPERFQGQADIRSDVYAVGLTLYEALALRPAFDDRGQAQLMHQITTVEPSRLDGLNPHLPRDLVTVVHKAMAKDPSDRYQTAGALAEDLNRFLEDRPIAARRLSVLEHGWRWCRRNPGMTGLLAALLALILLVTGGTVFLVQQHAKRQTEMARNEEALREEVGAALAQAASLRKGYRFHEGHEVLEQARKRLNPAGPDDLRRQVDQAQSDLELAEHLDIARLEAATLVEGRFQLAAAEPLYEATFVKAGLGVVTDDGEAVAARVRELPMRVEIIAALDDWASITQDQTRRAWLLAVARGADPDPLRNRLRHPELWKDGAALTRLVQEWRVDEFSPQLATALGRVLLENGGDAVPLLTAAQARFPHDFWLNFELGGALYQARRLDEALGYYRVAVALRPETSAAYNSLGLTLVANDRPDEAIGPLQQALRLDSKNVWAHNNLGLVLNSKGRRDEAIEHYQQALSIDPRSAVIHDNLGSALRSKGRLEEAIGCHQKALQLNPNSAIAHANLGFALRAKGRPEEAVGHFQRALQLDPSLSTARVQLGRCCYAAARAAVRASAIQGADKARLGEPERADLRRQALNWLRTNLELTTKLQKDGKMVDWSLTDWQSDPALAPVRNPAELTKLPKTEREQWQGLWADVAALLAADPIEQARGHVARRDWTKAADCYARALKFDTADDGHMWFEYAAVLALSGDQPGHAKACAHMVARCGHAPNLRAYHVARACTLTPHAVAEVSLAGRRAETELKANARQSWSLTEQGALLYRAGQFPQAVALFEQSLRADPTPGQAVPSWLWLALANQRLGKSEEARRWLDKATAWLDQYRDGMPARAEEELGLHLHNWMEGYVLRREAEELLGTRPGNLN
jgi:serine/threonine protein kinase/Flp pilus assembly protein TadD